MATNHYFQAGIPGGRTSEQNLYEDLIIECLKIYGFDVFYLPRDTVYQDGIFNEDAASTFTSSYPIEMYLSNVDGFQGEGDLLSKFGVEIRDTATFIVSRRRWDHVVGRTGNTQLTNRPAEGDLLYFPLTNSYFEIRKVESMDPFFQVGKLFVYTLQCELFQYSSEIINTGDDEIDSLSDEKSLDVLNYEILTEGGSKLILEYETRSALLQESYSISTIDVQSQNEDFKTEIDILDFSETNPFGEIAA